jgi:hypothetical protein
VNEEEERGKIAALHRMDQKASRQKSEVLLWENGTFQD